MLLRGSATLCTSSEWQSYIRSSYPTQRRLDAARSRRRRIASSARSRTPSGAARCSSRSVTPSRGLDSSGQSSVGPLVRPIVGTRVETSVPPREPPFPGKKTLNLPRAVMRFLCGSRKQALRVRLQSDPGHACFTTAPMLLRFDSCFRSGSEKPGRSSRWTESGTTTDSRCWRSCGRTGAVRK